MVEILYGGYEDPGIEGAGDDLAAGSTFRAGDGCLFAVSVGDSILMAALFEAFAR